MRFSASTRPSQAVMTENLVLATLLIRNWAKVTGLDRIGFDSVCENASGKETEEVPSGGGQSEEGKHSVSEIEKGGPLGPPL